MSVRMASVTNRFACGLHVLFTGLCLFVLMACTENDTRENAVESSGGEQSNLSTPPSTSGAPESKPDAQPVLDGLDGQRPRLPIEDDASIDEGHR